MLLHESLTSRIIGAAFRVHNALGAGFLESVYRNAMVVELRSEGLTVQPEATLTVHYRGQPIGTCFADLLVENLVVVELKAKEGIRPGHEMQCLAYLRTSGHETGLVLNFGPVRVDVKRMINSRGVRKSG